MKNSPLQAFTLIELLVVITIIAIMASLAIPVVQSSIERGRSAKCMNQLRSIGTAMLQYVVDHDYRFPAIEVPGIEIPPEVENRGTALELLGDYGINESTLSCPTDLASRRNIDTYNTSYHFSPRLQDESAVSPTIYTRRGTFQLNSIANITMAADYEALHKGKKNRVLGDGRVIQR